MIGIVIPHKEESALLRGHAPQAQKESHRDFQFWRWSAGPNEVVLVHCGMGNEKSYAATQKLIENYSLQWVLHFGIAGALIDELPVGQLVGALSVNGAKLCTDLQKRFGSFSALQWLHLASVDEPIVNQQQRDNLKNLSQADVVDCESAGCLKACLEHKLPLLVLRGVTDHANENTPKLWKPHWDQHKEAWTASLREFLATPG